jgi:solute carrier family 45 protein 1/2/4
MSTAARSVTDIQGKSQSSPCLPIPRRKSDPNPIISNELPPPSHPRLHLLGSDGTSLTAGRVSSFPVYGSQLIFSRPQAQSGLWRNLRSIWDNMFTLPKGIRTVCYIQFFALYVFSSFTRIMERADDSLGWFPILFFTSIWVSEIYKSSYTGPEIDEIELNAQGVRAGARALLFQALVNITCSIGLPYLVTESGVQANTSGRYQSLQPGRGEEEDGWKPMNMVNDIRSGGLPRKMVGAVVGLARGIKDGNVLTIPIKGLTLVRLWWISQFTFAGAMAMTW